MKRVFFTILAMFTFISLHAQKSTGLSTTETTKKESKVENSNGAKPLSEASKSNAQVPMTRKIATQPAIKREEKIKND